MTDRAPNQARLLAGPPGHAGAEPLAAHEARLGALPPRHARRDIIQVIEAAGLLGRGGAGFPVGRKWRSVTERAAGRGIVLANGAEGEPASAKDRTLMALRPHLVIDGAVLAAEAVGAEEVVLYVGTEHGPAVEALGRALDERRAGPRSSPPRPFERGVGGRPTLVQNVESLAHGALIARYGDDWYRGVGEGATRGTALITLGGAVARPGVREIALGVGLGDVAEEAGALRATTSAVLLGGYFGGWAATDDAWELALEPVAMRAAGRSFGCGVVWLLPGGACGVIATARIMRFMAGQSARQCGPCVLGLGAISGAADRLATGAPQADDLARIGRWSAQLAGRGACRHPDGAVGLMSSALATFGDEFALHQRAGRCSQGRSGRMVA